MILIFVGIIVIRRKNTGAPNFNSRNHSDGDNCWIDFENSQRVEAPDFAFLEDESIGIHDFEAVLNQSDISSLTNMKTRDH